MQTSDAPRVTSGARDRDHGETGPSIIPPMGISPPECWGSGELWMGKRIRVGVCFDGDLEIQRWIGIRKTAPPHELSLRYRGVNGANLGKQGPASLSSSARGWRNCVQPVPVEGSESKPEVGRGCLGGRPDRALCGETLCEEEERGASRRATMRRHAGIGPAWRAAGVCRLPCPRMLSGWNQGREDVEGGPRAIRTPEMASSGGRDHEISCC